MRGVIDEKHLNSTPQHLLWEFSWLVSRMVARYCKLKKAERPVIGRRQGHLTWKSTAVKIVKHENYLFAALGLTDTDVSQDEFVATACIDPYRNRKNIILTCDGLIPSSEQSRPFSDQVAWVLALREGDTQIPRTYTANWRKLYPWWYAFDLCFKLLREDGVVFHCAKEDRTMIHLQVRPITVDKSIDQIEKTSIERNIKSCNALAKNSSPEADASSEAPEESSEETKTTSL